MNKDKKKKKINELLKFAGIADKNATNLTEKELREIHAKKYSNK